jgi:hypothetical protein
VRNCCRVLSSPKDGHTGNKTMTVDVGVCEDWEFSQLNITDKMHRYVAHAYAFPLSCTISVKIKHEKKKIFCLHVSSHRRIGSHVLRYKIIYKCSRRCHTIKGYNSTLRGAPKLVRLKDTGSFQENTLFRRRSLLLSHNHRKSKCH